MTKLKQLKLKSPNLAQVFARQLVTGQKVKGEGHRVIKYKKAIEWPV